MSQEEQDAEEWDRGDEEDSGSTCRLLKGVNFIPREGPVEGSAQGLTCLLTRITLAAVLG